MMAAALRSTKDIINYYDPATSFRLSTVAENTPPHGEVSDWNYCVCCVVAKRLAVVAEVQRVNAASSKGPFTAGHKTDPDKERYQQTQWFPLPQFRCVTCRIKSTSSQTAEPE